MKTTFLFLLLAATVVAGCSHTNNLAKYDVAGKTALFRAYTTGSASSFAYVHSPDSDNTLANIASTIGSGIVSDQARKKLDRAINRDSIADAVSRGMRQSATDYLRLQPVKSIEDAPDLIIETNITEFRLVSGAYGLTAKVVAESRIIDRATGGLVWDNCESHSIPLSRTYPASFGPDVVQAGASIYNAVQLLNMGEEEITRVVNEAAAEAGREIGEVLREDVAEMHAR